MIYCIQDEHANQYTTGAVQKWAFIVHLIMMRFFVITVSIVYKPFTSKILNFYFKSDFDGFSF
jgi:hypothetical protein